MANVTELHVNGMKVEVNAAAERSLLSVLRDDLGLTGSKYGCGEGQCGACTVLLDGSPARSCITTAGEAAGRKIVTIEGLEHDGELHPLQEAFLETGALQCGYCTSGMIIAAAALLGKNPNPTPGEIIRHMDGNICRCGVYQRILAAIARASTAMKEAKR
jgi:aerobic-type carbon monoxide dehydrogenase small subunit (CoxS/CutS family)